MDIKKQVCVMIFFLCEWSWWMSNIEGALGCEAEKSLITSQNLNQRADADDSVHFVDEN